MAEALAVLLPGFPGRHHLFLGGLGNHPAFATFVNDDWALALDGDANPEGLSLRVDLNRLPFASGSVDALVLPLTFDTSVSPQRVMREAERVLTDDGLLIIFCINPWSLWHLWQVLRGRSLSDELIGQKHWLSRRRVCEWLALLGFDPEKQLGLLYPLPGLHVDPQARLGRFFQTQLAGWGTLYGIKAVKRTLPLTRLPMKTRRLRFASRPSRPTVAVGRLR